MARVIWTQEGLRNLNTIRAYTLEAAPARADALLDGIVEAIERLLSFPRLGRTVRELEPSPLREIIYEHYRIIYSIEGSEVGIVTIVHSAMDVAARLRALGLSDA